MAKSFKAPPPLIDLVSDDEEVDILVPPPLPNLIKEPDNDNEDLLNNL